MLTIPELCQQWRGFHVAPLGLAVAAVVLSWASVSRSGSFLDCADIQQDDRDQIVIGDIELLPDGGDDEAAELARRRLRQGMRQQFAEFPFWPGGDVYIVLCPGHKPDRGDYTDVIVERRYASGVLVELWGMSSKDRAWVDYAVLPLLGQARQGAGIDGFYEAGYRVNPAIGIEGVFNDALEPRAFTTLAAGLRSLERAMRSGHSELFELTYKTLCEAYHLLGRAESRANPDGPLPSEWRKLRALALEGAGAAAADPRVEDTLAYPPAGVTVGSCDVPPPDPPVPAPANADAGDQR